MTTPFYLALALHNHQPVGNFENVFEEAYQKSYLPMLEALERHPGVRLAIHNTGCLLDWLITAHPEYIERLAALVARGQIEIMTGGYYEPILVSLPDKDKKGQIKKLTRAVKQLFGYKAQGAWLAERVWEPHLPTPLAAAGVAYTIVDDTHFRYAGLDDDDMFGYYLTEDQGHAVKVFGTAKHLRYTIPWTPASEVIDWLRLQAGRDLPLYAGRPKVAVMGDDGEKFGLWPRTYKHCWEDGWVEAFFTALEENADWLRTITPAEAAAMLPPLGQIYMPAASYDEMTEWALPGRYAAEIVHLKHELEAEGRHDILRYIKGGLWRGFMAKYPEVNQMHKKALSVSAQVRDMTRKRARREARAQVWAAQCNCGYWHGVFGGIYLFHIRGINYRKLIAAEGAAEAERGLLHTATAELTDFTRSGSQEIILRNGQQWLLIDATRGGSVLEWDYRAAPYNLLNTMTRREEGYHAAIREAAAQGTMQISSAEGAVENVHSAAVKVRELGLEKKLVYDWYRRGALQERFMPFDWTPAAYAEARGELGDFVNQPYTATLTETETGATVTLTRQGGVWQTGWRAPVTVQKRLTLGHEAAELTVHYSLTNHGDQPLRARFGVENNWGLEGGQDPLTFFTGLDPDGARCYPGQAGVAGDITQYSLISEIITVGARIDMHVSQAADVWWFPIETVTNSEAGYEANYQGTAVLTSWQIDLAPGASWVFSLRFVLRSAFEAPTE